MQEKIVKGEVDIVVVEVVEVVEVVDITTYKKVPSIQDYLKDSLGKINMADMGKEAKLPPPSFTSPPLRDWWR